MMRPKNIRSRIAVRSLTVAALLVGLGVQAATVTGNLLNLSGNAYATNVLFTPLSTPQIDAGNLVVGPATNVIATGGAFSVALKQGDYRVTIGGRTKDSFVITVPSGSASVNISTLITSEISYPYSFIPGYEVTSARGAASGYAPLDAAGKVPVTHVPAENGTVVIPLDIPTPDQGSGTVYKSVTHPDVAYFANGLFGWRYWMGFTPYPPEDRENPCVAVSQDGVTWSVPSGLVNPLAPLSEATAANYLWQADTDVLQQPNGLLAVYYMNFHNSPSKWALCKKTTADGVTWSGRTVCLTGTDDFDEFGMISPALVNEGDGTMTVFYIRRKVAQSYNVTTITRSGTTATATTALPHNYTTGDKVRIVGANQELYNGTYAVTVTSGTTFTYVMGADPGSSATGTLTAQWPAIERIFWRTSADNGATWSAETMCSYSVDRMEFPAPWHMDVTKVGNKYHGLIMGQEGKLYYAYSTDKTSWTFEPSHSPCLPVSGYPFDGATVGAVNYRSTIVGVPGDVDKFDLFVVGLPAGAAGSGSWPAGNPWRVGLYRGVKLPSDPARILNGYVHPPASQILFNTAAAWPSANMAIFHNFSLERMQKVRYVRWFMGPVSNGSIEVGLGSLSGDDFTPIKSSGVIATPSADSEVRIDLGTTVLPPGRYAVYVWCNSGTAQFYWGYANPLRLTRMVGTVVTTANGLSALTRRAYTLTMDSGRVITGLSLQGDF